MNQWRGISVSRSRVQAQNPQGVHLPRPVQEYRALRGGPEAGWRGSTPLNSTNARLLVRGEYVASPSAHFANTRFEFTRNFLVVTRTDVGNVETRFGRVHVSSKKAASTARRPLRYAASPLRLLRGRLAQRDLHVSLPAARRAARGACPQRARCPACL